LSKGLTGNYQYIKEAKVYTTTILPRGGIDVSCKSIAVSVTAFVLLSGTFVTYAEPTLYTPDRWHTRIYFTVSHMGLSNYGGRFIEHDIQFMFDEENMENSSVEVTVPVSGIDTFSPELNGKMPNPEFFDTENHPLILFKSTDIEQVDGTRARMTGDLTIKGKTLPIIFDVTFNKKVVHPFFKLNNIGFTAVATLDNRAYGVNPLPDWMLASTVKVRVEMEAFEGDTVPYYSEE
jgi:polyisoprenoid-binding protein YceI